MLTREEKSIWVKLCQIIRNRKIGPDRSDFTILSNLSKFQNESHSPGAKLQKSKQEINKKTHFQRKKYNTELERTRNKQRSYQNREVKAQGR